MGLCATHQIRESLLLAQNGGRAEAGGICCVEFLDLMRRGGVAPEGTPEAFELAPYSLLFLRRGEKKGASSVVKIRLRRQLYVLN